VDQFGLETTPNRGQERRALELISMRQKGSQAMECSPRAIAKWSFRTGCALAVVWLLAVTAFLAAGYLDGVVFAMVLVPIAGGLMLLAMMLSAFGA
jgi:hypothetical protein